MDKLEMIAFEIISNVGTAKSLVMEGIAEARTGKFEAAEEKFKEAEEYFIRGHKVHSEMIQQEAMGEKVEFSMLIMHAEDQLMSAETIKCIATELVEIYKFQHELKIQRL